MGNIKMKLDQRFRMAFYLYILICQAVRWCPAPKGKRMGETGAGPKYMSLDLGLGGLTLGLHCGH